MPINRPDGRHWCAPDQEEPGEDGSWTCPDCMTVWLHSVVDGSVLWETSEVREQRLAAAATAEQPPTSEEPLSASEEGTSGG